MLEAERGRRWERGHSFLSRGLCGVVLLFGTACGGDPPTFAKMRMSASSDPNVSGEVTDVTSGSNAASGSNANGSNATNGSNVTSGSSTTGGPNVAPDVSPTSGGSTTATTSECRSGQACNDGKSCTENDKCDSEGTCVGTPRDCSDGVECNGDETCDETEGGCVGGSSACTDGMTCNVESDMCDSTCDGCVIDGSCYADGVVSPTDPCFICDAGNPTEWSVDANATCDDDDLCTEEDTCNSDGQCEGTEVACDDDGGECGATRACDPETGLCAATYPDDDVSCDDGNACTANDSCDGEGGCTGTPATGGECDCLEDSDCDDDVECTTDSCNEGTCSSVLEAQSCRINNTCIEDGTVDPTNPCRLCDASSNQTGWTNANQGTSCDDELWCNGDDTCNAGTCTHAYPNNNRCAGLTGDCETTTCDETRKNCFRPATYVCDSETMTGCSSDACSGDVVTWQVDTFCKGDRADCSGGEVVSTEDDPEVIENCAAQTVCNADTAECELALECSNDTYCDEDSGLCWMNRDTMSWYTQQEGIDYCDDLDFAGSDDWHLPTNEEARTISECPTNFCSAGEGPGVDGCYWPVQMGPCDYNLWLDNTMSGYWVVTNGAIGGTSFGDFPVRCVVEWPGH